MVADNETIHNAIRSRFKSQVADALGLAVQYDNAPVARRDGEQWMRLTIRDGEWRQQTIGAQRRYRNNGLAIASIFVPANQGDRDALTIADAIVSAFRGVTVDDVRYLTPSVRSAGLQQNEWQVNVHIPFVADDNET
jgi:hypothetical protein